MKRTFIAGLLSSLVIQSASAVAIRPSKITISEPGEYTIPVTMIGTAEGIHSTELRIFKSLNQPIEEGILLDQVDLEKRDHHFQNLDLNFTTKGRYLLCAGFYKSQQYLRSCSQILVGQ